MAGNVLLLVGSMKFWQSQFGMPDPITIASTLYNKLLVGESPYDWLYPSINPLSSLRESLLYSTRVEIDR